MLSIIPAPKGFLQKIRAVQRTFLWSGNLEKRKWSLIAWNKLCKPKHLGGLNLQDPSMINRAYGAKLWWKWLKEPNLPWAKHWKEKYAPKYSSQNLIRMQENPEGSPIWNLARNNRKIIQEHSFWEIRDGKTALFWEDARQQLPKLERPEFADCKRNNQELGRTIVNHYWKPNERDRGWRTWIFNEIEDITKEYNSMRNLRTQLDKRRIQTTRDRDRLRWAKLEGGKFMLREARTHLENLE